MTDVICDAIRAAKAAFRRYRAMVLMMCGLLRVEAEATRQALDHVS